MTSLDIQSIIRSQQIIDSQLRKAGLGHLQIVLNEETPERVIEGGWHHMGTTRMHDDPKHGVVDADCRVHGISNLFISGPSVFPTCGYANPVFTVMALAIRMADKIKSIAGI